MESNRNQKPAVARLRELLEDKSRIIVAPGVYDGFTARIALREGFDCLYMTGAGTTMSLLGMPDLGLATLNDMRNQAGMIASLDRAVPLIADADTGYGGPLMVARTVSQYIGQGVAGLHLEDQVQSKRCGHLAGKELVDVETFLSRIRAAAMAREQSGDIVLIARTDALQKLGYDEAIRRLKGAVEAGADVAFLEGMTSKDEAARVCKELAPTPVLLNMVGGGVTPDMTAGTAKQLGFRIMIFPVTILAAAYEATSRAVKELRETGTVKQSSSTGVRELFEVCGLSECVEFDKAAGGRSYSTGI